MDNESAIETVRRVSGQHGVEPAAMLAYVLEWLTPPHAFAAGYKDVGSADAGRSRPEFMRELKGVLAGEGTPPRSVLELLHQYLNHTLGINQSTLDQLRVAGDPEKVAVWEAKVRTGRALVMVLREQMNLAEHHGLTARVESDDGK